MALKELLNDRTLDQYKGGSFLFYDRNTDVEVKGSICLIVEGDDRYVVHLSPDDTEVKSRGKLRRITFDDLQKPIEEEAGMSVDLIPHGIEIQWAGREHYAKIEKRLG